MAGYDTSCSLHSPAKEIKILTQAHLGQDMAHEMRTNVLTV